MYCVYKHTSPNGKSYIGMTKQTPEKRWQNGLGYRNQTRFYRAILKYGWENFTHEILANELSLSEAENLEKQLIAKHKSSDKRFGYNVESGGNCKKGISKESLEKMKRSMASPSYKEKILAANARRWETPGAREHMRELFSGERNPMYGRKMSEEHKRKLLEASKNAVRKPKYGEDNNMYGKHHSEETKRKISESRLGSKNWRAKTVLCVETGDVYGSVKDAFRETGIHFSSIAKCCCGVNLTAGGFHWKYVEGV